MFQNTISRPAIVPSADRTQDDANLTQSKPDGMMTKAAAMLVLLLCICLIQLIDMTIAGSNGGTGGSNLVD